jgi:hypothetical protein
LFYCEGKRKNQLPDLNLDARILAHVRCAMDAGTMMLLIISALPPVAEEKMMYVIKQNIRKKPWE